MIADCEEKSLTLLEVNYRQCMDANMWGFVVHIMLHASGYGQYDII